MLSNIRFQYHILSRILSYRQFDHYAMSIIDQCFDNDEYFAVELLKEKAAAFDNVDPLKVAQEADCQIFLSSKCVQRYLDNKW